MQVCLYAALLPCPGGQRPHLGCVAADDRNQALREQPGAHIAAQAACTGRDRVENDRMAELFRRPRCAKHGLLRTDSAHVEHERLRVGGDLLDLALVLRHDGGAACRENDVRAVVDRHRICDAMRHRAVRDRALNYFFELFPQRSAPSRLPRTCVRLSADSTSTEIAAPTAVETRKLGTKVKSAALVLPMRTAAIG